MASKGKIEALAYLRTSSKTNVGADKDSDKRQRAAIGNFAKLGGYEIVQELQQKGATIVLSSHALTELEERARRIIILNRGHVVAAGSIEQLRRIAGLPIRIRVTVASGQAQRLSALVGPVPNWREINGHLVEFDAAPGAKIELIRRVTDKGGPAEDVAIVQPTLDDLYAHFLRHRGESP